MVIYTMIRMRGRCGFTFDYAYGTAFKIPGPGFQNGTGIRLPESLYIYNKLELTQN